jgi:cobalt-precorrin-5B (C1)-methyltransferase
MEPPREGLRYGYTTGACATAATRGALLALICQRRYTEATITLPGGQVVTFNLHSCTFGESEGWASVIKDAGDDPDVTHQAEVCARVTWGPGPGVTFRRGAGVGLVTRKGLPVPPGEPAINPVPRQMMAATVAEVLSARGLAERGVVVEVSVPGGEELAKKTFNPRLGIVGGISILGTTGIVVPYSTAAWLASVLQGIDVAVAGGYRELVLAVGARGERLARRLLGGPEESFVQVGPFFGEALRHCAAVGVRKATLATMVGKLAKFAAGNESVHSSGSQQDFAFLADLARAAGAGPELAERVAGANTALEVSEQVAEAGLVEFHPLLCRRAHACAAALAGPCTVEVWLLSQEGVLLGRHPAAVYPRGGPE